MAATAKAPMTRPVRRTRNVRALTPAPRNMARLRMMTGEARSVDRMARPAVVSTMIAFSTDPTVEGSL